VHVAQSFCFFALVIGSASVRPVSVSQPVISARTGAYAPAALALVHAGTAATARCGELLASVTSAAMAAVRFISLCDSSRNEHTERLKVVRVLTVDSDFFFLSPEAQELPYYGSSVWSIRRYQQCCDSFMTRL
jgi:hypothetical protein